MKPVTETPEVRKAREEHERLWKEAARLNGIDPDTRDLYNPTAERFDNESYDNDNDERELEGQVSNQHQSLARYPILPYSQHIAPENAKTFGKIDGDSVIVESTNNNEVRSRFARQQKNEVEEVTSEPRGFFYSFDYPVPFIVERNAKLRQTKGEEEAQASYNVPHLIDIRFQNDDIKENEEEIQSPRVSEKIHDRIVVEDEVHDEQKSPKQHHATVSEKIRDGYVAPEEIHDEQTSPKQRNALSVSAKTRDGYIAKDEVQDAQSSPKQILKRGRGSVKFNSRKN